mmetsp:Transcript_31873/g.83210  ORF Transcript_31873/g.83210 Transcript_31873/m.83210 type:complete len:240 (+) Transcript_31873:269-988(+)
MNARTYSPGCSLHGQATRSTNHCHACAATVMNTYYIQSERYKTKKERANKNGEATQQRRGQKRHAIFPLCRIPTPSSFAPSSRSSKGDDDHVILRSPLLLWHCGGHVVPAHWAAWLRLQPLFDALLGKEVSAPVYSRHSVFRLERSELNRALVVLRIELLSCFRCGHLSYHLVAQPYYTTIFQHDDHVVAACEQIQQAVPSSTLLSSCLACTSSISTLPILLRTASCSTGGLRRGPRHT